MSNSLSSGYYSSQSLETKDKECNKTPDKVHEWIKHGSWPSLWYTCKYCKEVRYTK